MEDEGFVDDELIEETAREFVAMHGANAVALLQERAHLAAASGNDILAQTWREIQCVAEHILGVGFW